MTGKSTFHSGLWHNEHACLSHKCMCKDMDQFFLSPPLGSGLGPSVGSAIRDGGRSENLGGPWSPGQATILSLLMENILLSFQPRFRGGGVAPWPLHPRFQGPWSIVLCSSSAPTLVKEPACLPQAYCLKSH